MSRPTETPATAALIGTPASISASDAPHALQSRHVPIIVSHHIYRVPRSRSSSKFVPERGCAQSHASTSHHLDLCFCVCVPGHGGGAVALRHLGRDAHGVGEVVGRGHDGQDGLLGQGTVAHHTPAAHTGTKGQRIAQTLQEGRTQGAAGAFEVSAGQRVGGQGVGMNMISIHV